MIMLLQLVFRVVFLPLLGLSLASCRGQEDETSGWCRLSCSTTTLAADDFSIEPQLVPGEGQCRSASGSAGLMTTTWTVTGPFPDSLPGSGFGSGGGNTDPVKKSSIAFNATLAGVIPYTEGDPSENSGDGYQGIKTPKSEWCTDSCGVARLKYEAECSDIAQEGSITIESGAVSNVVTFTIPAPTL